ncbi:MAG: hypothetical protein IV097_06265 [Burkholderiaceae bacterium]|nr:hypothetical protein [Burkholderiaceae bacterium]
MSKILSITVLVTGISLAGAASAQGNSIVYRCPGPPVLYTDALSAKEAQDKGCRTIEGAPITVMQTSKPKAAPNPANATPASAASRPGDTRIDPAQQKSRDSDARRILEAELRKEEERLQALQKEYNGGEPERRGDERNYQRYIDRVAEMKASISRKESDIAAIKRELSKLGS